mmetsp:Transcript_43123/g.130305  ORF Transcript_43123/g.130305 Transcript_43123/m.130305 type:complete len:218 (+) Transcript_43123:256-909(+)
MPYHASYVRCTTGRLSGDTTLSRTASRILARSTFLPIVSGHQEGESGQSTYVSLSRRANKAPSVSPAPSQKHASWREAETTCVGDMPTGGAHKSRCGGSFGNACQTCSGLSVITTSAGRRARGVRRSAWTWKDGGLGIRCHSPSEKTFGLCDAKVSCTCCCSKTRLCSASNSSTNVKGTYILGSPLMCIREMFPGDTMPQSSFGEIASKLQTHAGLL